MKSIIVFALFVAAAVAAPTSIDAQAEIVEQSLDNIGVDGYTFHFITNNGLKRQETAKLVDVGTVDEGIALQGQYSYVGDDGITYTVTYTADKNGFQAQGNHIPQP